MTNTGFVALPVLQATYGPRAVLPAAIATVFVAVVMFPAAVILQELDPSNARELCALSPQSWRGGSFSIRWSFRP